MEKITTVIEGALNHKRLIAGGLLIRETVCGAISSLSTPVNINLKKTLRGERVGVRGKIQSKYVLDVISLGVDGLVGGVELNSDIGNWES